MAHILSPLAIKSLERERAGSTLNAVMTFAGFQDRVHGAGLLQRSLERGRLAHAYLFTGSDGDLAESLATILVKTLNCENPVRVPGNSLPIDCCDHCNSCRRINEGNHPDVHWVRPESKSRIITIDQMRELMQEVHLKPLEGGWKAGIIVAADRLNIQAANAFLKTLEEPPPSSVLILLSTEPGRLLETILSRCLRLNLGENLQTTLNQNDLQWLRAFCEAALVTPKNLLVRYKMLGVLMKQLALQRQEIETALTEKSPLEKYDEVDASLRTKWEEELTAAIEAEYRRRRTLSLGLIQHWLRDVWMLTLSEPTESLHFVELAESTAQVANSLSSEQALENLQMFEKTRKLLETNVQEALAIEVGLLKLHL